MTSNLDTAWAVTGNIGPMPTAGSRSLRSAGSVMIKNLLIVLSEVSYELPNDFILAVPVPLPRRKNTFARVAYLPIRHRPSL